MNNQYGQGNAFIKQETVANSSAATPIVAPPAATSFEAYVLNTTLNGASETSIVVTVAPPTSLGTKGTIKVHKDNGSILSIAYTNRSGATFTVAATDFSSGEEATAGNVVAIGNENRVIIRGWSANAVNNAAGLQTLKLQTAAGAEVLVGNILGTGDYQSDNSGTHIPLPAGETLDIKLSAAATTLIADVTVWGEYAPHGVPQCTGYVYGTP